MISSAFHSIPYVLCMSWPMFLENMIVSCMLIWNIFYDMCEYPLLSCSWYKNDEYQQAFSIFSIGGRRNLFSKLEYDPVRSKWLDKNGSEYMGTCFHLLSICVQFSIQSRYLCTWCLVHQCLSNQYKWVIFNKHVTIIVPEIIIIFDNIAMSAWIAVPMFFNFK